MDPVTGFAAPGPPETMIKMPPATISSTARGTAMVQTIKLYIRSAITKRCRNSHRQPGDCPQGTRLLAANGSFPFASQVLMFWQFGLQVAVLGGSHCSPASIAPLPQPPPPPPALLTVITDGAVLVTTPVLRVLLAVMFAVPALTPVTRPLRLTVATAVLLDAQSISTPPVIELPN